MFLLLVLPLTAVLVPSASSQASCTGGKLEESSINDILKVINNKRSKVASGLMPDSKNPTAGTMLPAAAPMNKLKWSCDLETDAITKLGESCSTTPAPTADSTHTGYFYPDTGKDGYPVSVVVNEWLDEINQNAWPGSISATELKTPATAPTPDPVENFANLIRGNTQAIGCAQLDCPGSTPGTSQTYVFCQTDQPPLKYPEDVYTVGTTCTDNTPCTITPNTKCDTAMGLCEEPVVSTTAASTTAESTTAASTAATTGVTTAAETTTEASYPGELPTGTDSLCPDNVVVGMTDELRMHFLDTQNYRRSILAKGQVPRPSGNLLPQGANIIKLRLGCKLEEEAIKEVRQCPTSKTPHDKYGKNFDTFASSTATSTYRDAIKKAVTNWWKVSRTEREGPGVNAVTFREWHVDAPVATYTQIAWANTKEIGCAIAKCSSSYTVICLYDPAGNIPEEPMYKIGAPGTACPSGTTPDSALGLCVQN